MFVNSFNKQDYAGKRKVTNCAFNVFRTTQIVDSATFPI